MILYICQVTSVRENIVFAKINKYQKMIRCHTLDYINDSIILCGRVEIIILAKLYILLYALSLWVYLVTFFCPKPLNLTIVLLDIFFF